MRLDREGNIIQHGKVQEYAGDLERSSKAESRAPMGWELRDIAAIEHDPTVIRCDLTGKLTD